MRMPGLIATCSIVLLCTITATSYLEIQTTDKVTAAIKEKDSMNQTINNYETNNYETNNYYENDDSEKIEELEEKISELEEEKEDISNEQVLVGVTEHNIVYNIQPQEDKEPWHGPKSYKCNRAAGYPAICGYCGEQGEIHFNIQEWQDTQGTYHLTHKGCGAKYCESVGVEPRIDEAYKLR